MSQVTGRGPTTQVLADVSPPIGRRFGDELRRQRLEHRAARLERVLLALHERVRAREMAGLVPPPLWAAIDGFEHELRAVRRQLREPW